MDLRVAESICRQVGEQSSREAEGERVVREEAMRPFDLEHGPLLRVIAAAAGRGGACAGGDACTTS